MSPRMFVVAGPPGGGKSSVFSRSVSGIADVFNADDRAAELNGGSYRGIPQEIRAATNREFEQFIISHIREHKDFAFETTLRTPITFRQAAMARQEGFHVSMAFVALRTPEMHIDRVIARAEAGGHSAPPERIREIYKASLKNLPRALARIGRRRRLRQQLHHRYRTRTHPRHRRPSTRISDRLAARLVDQFPPKHRLSIGSHPPPA